YAARDRGRFIVYPTDNGKLEWNKNVPSWDLINAINGGNAGWPFPIALFPPNPLDLYDLTINSLDWVDDWYANDYYEHSDKSHKPTGPESGEERVQRSWPNSDSRAAMTMSRRSDPPTPPADRTQDTTLNGFRCSVQSAKPVGGG